MVDNETENERREKVETEVNGTISQDALLKLPFAFGMLKRFNAHLRCGK